MKNLFSFFSLAIIIFLNGCQEDKTSVPINVIENKDPYKEESPDFVSFLDFKFPKGWITYSWDMVNNQGYDDNYSLKSVNSMATVYATKTMNVPGYVTFYTYIAANSNGKDIDLYIDDEKAQALHSKPVNNDWVEWIYVVDTGKHTFRWQTEGARKYLDAISFKYDTW